ncbi:diguanylate cyclase domain-containing protein [Neptuniibacter sp. UBA6509]|uniref:diguanylate cyclase domain-containing protein n=1 Tax=Neptuniibacter sp. UBA6509 TaxID=1946976 RepID=UPI0039C92B02
MFHVRSFSESYPDYSLSIGVASTGPDQYISLDELLAEADRKMYQAKDTVGSYIQC